MNGQAIMTVAAAVVGLTQLVKWAGIPDRMGPLVVMVLSLIGVAVYGVSQEELVTRLQLFDYFAGWIAVSTSSAGVFGFTRAAATAVTAAKPPPAGGAGMNPTLP